MEEAAEEVAEEEAVAEEVVVEEAAEAGAILEVAEAGVEEVEEVSEEEEVEEIEIAVKATLNKARENATTAIKKVISAGTVLMKESLNLKLHALATTVDSLTIL